METIELNLMLDKNQFEAIVSGLKALTAALSNTYIDTNTDKDTDTDKATTPTNANTSYDYKSRVDAIITNLAANTRLDTSPRGNTSSDDANTYKDTLHRGNTTTATANNNNINNNTVVVDDDDDEEVNIVVNNANTYIDTGIPTLEEITKYVDVRNYRMSPQKFFDYYKRRNWKTKGGVSIVGQWKGFVDNWAKNEFAPKQQAGNTGTVEERRAAHKFVPTVFE